MKKYIRNNQTVSGKLLDEQVMLDIEKGKYFSLNPVATKIWDFLEQSLTTDALCRKLVDNYDVELEKCKAETNEYLQEMIALGLIREIK